jgi:hypothetical protein
MRDELAKLDASLLDDIQDVTSGIRTCVGGVNEFMAKSALCVVTLCSTLNSDLCLLRSNQVIPVQV